MDFQAKEESKVGCAFPTLSNIFSSYNNDSQSIGLLQPVDTAVAPHNLVVGRQRVHQSLDLVVAVVFGKKEILVCNKIPLGKLKRLPFLLRSLLLGQRTLLCLLGVLLLLAWLL